MNEDFGTVQYEGKTLVLTQQAFLSNSPNDQCYIAQALDAEGNEYRVRWEVREGWMEMEDESECCDWTRYEVTAL